MNAMIVLRLEGEAGFLLVDPVAGTVRPVEAVDAPEAHAGADGAPKLRGVAEAYAVPAMPSIPSRKFFLS
jgi:hypothetical protein